MPTVDRIRDLLLTPEEAAQLDAPGQKDAAVLVPLYLQDDALHAVFTKRREDLRRHAGEISFPGGRQDEPDEDLRFTALREAEEEIGLPTSDVELIGALPPVGTFVTDYKIHPFVGLIDAGKTWELQPTEVEVVLEFSLRELVEGHQMKRLIRRGVPFRTATYTVNGNMIWGATGRIVQDLLERLDPVI